MFKKFILIILLFTIILPSNIYASTNSLARIGNNYYDTLRDAIANVNSNETIILTTNIKEDNSLIINKTVNINLNGKNITAPEKVFLVEGGSLNLSGKGTIKEEKPNYGAIMIKGSTDPDDTNYSTLTVGSDVTLEGWSGIFISHTNSKSYGVKVDFSGNINAVSDTSGGEGIGIYVNGNIKAKDNVPVINIKDGANITSNGNGLYIAGYSIFNIDKATISGLESGIGIKSGILNINGATVTCNGEDTTPTEGYNNGIKHSGTAIQIESNDGYAGNMELNIKSGNFRSKNSNVIYEYIGRGSNTMVNSIDITSGTFISEKNKDTLRFSNSFKNKHTNFIKGGNYSSDPTNYLDIGYKVIESNNIYNVVKSTYKSTTGNNVVASYNDNNLIIWLVIISSIVILLASIIFFNKKKILNLFKTR